MAGLTTADTHMADMVLDHRVHMRLGSRSSSSSPPPLPQPDSAAATLSAALPYSPGLLQVDRVQVDRVQVVLVQVVRVQGCGGDSHRGDG